MAGSAKSALLLAVAALLAAAITACGGGGSTDQAASTQTTDTSTTAQGDAGEGSGGSAGTDGEGDRAKGAGDSSGGSESGSGGSSSGSGGSGSGSGGSGSNGSGSGGSGSGGADELIRPFDEDSAQEFGDDASGAERAQASSEVESYMRARQAGDQQGACAALSTTAKGHLSALAQAVEGVGEGESCVAIFTEIDESTPASVRANTMTGPISELRVEGARGVALYNGKESTNYAIHMEREGGAWKVAMLAPYPIS